MIKEICFDLDGTIANFYGVKNWLEYLENFDTTPYEIAKPLINMNSLARAIHKVQTLGYSIKVISWTSKSGTDEYNERVAEVKRKWLAKHLGSVDFAEICIVPYGVAKSGFGGGILFDDEERNRTEWENANAENIACDVSEILATLRSLY